MPDIRRHPFTQPQWFVIHERFPSSIKPGEVINNGRLVWCPESAIDERKKDFKGVIGYIGCGFDVDDALARARAIDEFGGWEHVEKVDLSDLDYIEIYAEPDDLLKLQKGLPTVFETGPSVAIRASDLHLLPQVAAAGVPFSVEASSLTQSDLWPDERDEAEDGFTF